MSPPSGEVEADGSLVIEHADYFEIMDPAHSTYRLLVPKKK